MANCNLLGIVLVIFIQIPKPLLQLSWIAHLAATGIEPKRIVYTSSLPLDVGLRTGQYRNGNLGGIGTRTNRANYREGRVLLQAGKYAVATRSVDAASCPKIRLTTRCR